MLLYHGTAKKYLKTILTRGLTPRTNSVGNWQHTVDSNPNLVYLTSTYAPFFALNASERNFIVIEIDTDKLNPQNFRPDEDGLEQLTRGKTIKGVPRSLSQGSMEERTAYFRDDIDRYSEFWGYTLDLLGTCAYKGTIPVSAFTRIAEVDKTGNAPLWLSWDPSITLINHYLCHKRYQALTRWLMGDKVEVEETFDFPLSVYDEKTRAEMLKSQKALLENRKGIKVTRPNEKS